jgi:L-aspartate oxidase
MFAALEAQPAGPVLLITKDEIRLSNSWFAQGGIAAAIGDDDSPELHLQDTISAGAGLVDEEAARILCGEAPECIAALVELGVEFDRDDDGRIALGREAAHSRKRIIHAGGDRTGQGLVGGLVTALRASAVRVVEGSYLTRLLMEDGRVCGVETMDGDGNTGTAWAESVVLATGGAGQAYSHTTNPAVATGDGLWLAFEAGADVADMEFFQFHPTAFRREGYDPFLISEAVRGEGAVLRNDKGEAFMKRYHHARELAPRDILARAIVEEMKLTGADHVDLDCSAITHVDVTERFPGISQFCANAGIDIRTDPIPIAPAAHYFMGGVWTDTHGRTTLPGLYACGEVTCTGVHGANRLASNSLAETLVFARRAARHICAGGGGSAPRANNAIAVTPGPGIAPDRRTLGRLTWESCGIERDGEALAAALEIMRKWSGGDDARSVAALELRSLSTAGRLIAEAAMRREESRGAHKRRDFPERDDDHWQRRQVFRRGD